MARLKFLVFALIALGLWAYHLLAIAPLAVTGSVEQATAAVAGAAGPVAVALESRRSLVQVVALKVVGGSAAWNPGPKPGAKPEAPTVDRFATIRSTAVEAIPPELKDSLFLALTNETGVLWARGSGEPGTEAPAGLELTPVIEAGSAGAVRTIDGAGYLLFAVPMVVSDKNEVRQGGSAIVGLPLLPDVKVLEATAKSLGLTSLALVSEGKAVLTAGDKKDADAVLTNVKAGASSALGSGAVREVGPLALPMLAESLVHGIGSRQAIGGTPFEVAASASSRAALEALANYQVFGFGALLGLFLLAIVMTIVMGSTADEGGAAMVLPPPMPIPPKRDKGEEVPPTAKTPIAMQEQEAPPEASPDDFDFPPSTGSTGLQQGLQPPPAPVAQPPPAPPPFSSSGSTGQAPIFDPEPTSDPFANSAPPPPPPPSFARAAPPPPPVATSQAPAFQPAAGLMDEEEEGQRTVAYPAFKPAPGAAAAPPPSADPFAMAAAQQGYSSNGPSHEDNPDATRVAAVPAELIKAARAGASGNTGERPALKANTAALPKMASVAPAAAGNEEERHFQEVFRDFVATREKCREPADGLTFDKFKAKLLKNKEQLVSKYQCKTVRFQVYVKDGKAALKATPVKD